MIGDPRNDENVVVSQLQMAFAQAHNQLAAQVAADPAVGPDQRFEETQRLLRWHYQWIVAYDYLPKICGKELIELMSTTDGDGDINIKRRYYRPEKNPYMPGNSRGSVPLRTQSSAPYVRPECQRDASPHFCSGR